MTQTAAVSVDALERLGRAINDGTRARLLLRLAERPGYPAELAEELGTTRANMSNHLTCLRGCGLVKATPEGRSVRYELADERLGVLLTELASIAVAEHCDYCDGRQRARA